MSASGTRAWGPDVIRPDKEVLVIGRAATANVILLHPAVSRRHAEVSLVDGRVVVRDLASRLGTRVNGERIRERPLQDGDRVEFGPVAYEFHARLLRLLSQSAGVRLEARGLAVVRAGPPLLSGIDFTIPANQFVGILGASGSGKTTLIKCLAGYLSPASGQLGFDGQEVLTSLESYRGVAGYVPQDDVLYTPLTARENLDFALRLRLADDLQPQERAEVVTQTLERLRLTEHADKRVSILSGGERKRLNVALELLSRPRILYLDEPTSGLDPAAETRLMRLLKELAARGVTVVCATHVLENLPLFDQVVVVAERTVVYSGPPQDLLEHFQVSSYPELYESLEARTPHLPGQKEVTPAQPPQPALASSVLAGVALVKPLVPPPTATPRRIPWSSQVVVQFLRGLRLLRRDRPLLLLLLAQPVLIGLLINLSQLSPNGLAPIFLFAVVTSVWLGLNNTAREVVRERAIYVRERLAGVTPEGYLGAKVLLFGLVGLVQIGLLVFVLRHLNGLSPGDAHDLAAWSPLHLVLVLWSTYLSAMLLGLLISSLVRTQEAAVAFLPLIILPQLLLTGVVTGLDSARDGSFRSLAILVSRTGAGSRGASGWTLELVSLLTYSRPALALLQKVPVGEQSPPALVTFIDWMHLLLLLLLTALALAAAFSWRERRWLEQG